MIASSSAEKFAFSFTWGSGAATIYFHLSASDIAAITAAITCVLSAVAAAAMSFYFKKQHLAMLKSRIEKEESNAVLMCEVCPLVKNAHTDGL